MYAGTSVAYLAVRRKAHEDALGAALAAMATLGLQAQTAEVKTRTTTKIEVDGGRDVTLTGCVARSPGGTTFLLTNVGTTTGGLKTYHLVVDDRER